MRTDRCGKTGEQKYHVKGSRKDIKIQKSMYTDETNVEYEMYDYTGNNWSHRNTYKTFKEKLRSHTMKTFNRLTTTDSYTSNITLNTESAAVGNWKRERWGRSTRKKRSVTRDTMMTRMMIIIISQQYIDIEASNAWLTNPNLFAETQGFLTAV